MKLSNLIVERLTSVNQDVDRIYNKYFKAAYDYVQKTGKVDTSLLEYGRVSSDELRSQMARKATRVNPVTIHINTNGQGNAYNPKSSRIMLNVTWGAWEIAEQFGGVERGSRNVGDQGAMFLTEFEPHRMKGTIHHELNHWIDDSLHNKHIEQHVRRSIEKGASPQDNQGPIERNSQIHNIVQLKRHLKGEWNSLSFNDMVRMIPSLGVVSGQLSSKEYDKWRRNILNRMAREGLLSDNMRKSA